MSACGDDLPVALKRRTRAAHDVVEDAFDLPRRVRSLDAYRELLVTLHAFHRAWEAAAPEHSSGKSALLLRDLQALGLSAGEVKAIGPFDGLPDLTDEAARLGAAYVMHGAALGGLVIAAEAERRLGLDATSGCAFFRSDGKATAARWRVFQAKLAAAGRRLDEDAVVEGANGMFAAMTRCLQPSAASLVPSGEWMRSR